MKINEVSFLSVSCLLAALLALTRCAGNPEPLKSTTYTPNTSVVESQNKYAQSLMSASIRMVATNFFSLTNPNPSSQCAGDARIFSDPFAFPSPSPYDESDHPGFSLVNNFYLPPLPLPLPLSLTNSATTIAPSFIKNVSVDLTNANASFPTNKAYACSYGTGSNLPLASSCATFDYAQINGIPSTLGGSFLLLGGFSSTNYVGLGQNYNSTLMGVPFRGSSISCGPVLSSLYKSAYNLCPTNFLSLSVNRYNALNELEGEELSTVLSQITTPYFASNQSGFLLSSWSLLSNSSSYNGPVGTAGASVAYAPLQMQAVFFGGSKPLPSYNSLKSRLQTISPDGIGALDLGDASSGSATYNTWIFDLATQSWTSVPLNTLQDSSLVLEPDLVTSTGVKNLYQRSPPGGRSLFGYVAVPGFAISQFGSTGQIGGIGGDVIDTTDRILTIGGFGQCNDSGCSDTYSFNPTFGPEYLDTLNAPIDPAKASSYLACASSPNSTTTYLCPSSQLANLYPAQWIQSFPQRILSNNAKGSPFVQNPVSGNGPPAPNPSYSSSTYTPNSIPLVNFGAIALTNNNPTSKGVGVSGFQQVGNPSYSVTGAGYVMTAGGFWGLLTTPSQINSPNTTGNCRSIQECGGLDILLKWFNPDQGLNWSGNIERYAAHFTTVNHLYDYGTGYRGAPTQWVSLKDTSSNASNSTPWFGGANFLKGINIPYPSGSPYPQPSPSANLDYPFNLTPASLNQAVYFGGADCSAYLASGSYCPYWPSPGNAGRYWFFGLDPNAIFNNGLNLSQRIPWQGTAPMNAGMAAARGLDLLGHPIIVAWGGNIQPGINDTSSKIYYLYNNDTTSTPGNGVPRWASYAVRFDQSPQGFANASMVFSHATGKFYMYGGYNSNLGNNSDVWQLSVSPETPGCGYATASNQLDQCKFSWQIMNASTGTTCFPNCPPGRRSHRMVEANYHYFNSPEEPDCSSASEPCSFGIFMEGGTADGAKEFSDRWMWDPTAHGGTGHWQAVGNFPPRVNAQMASFEVNTKLPAPVTLHRALLFGGETGMEAMTGAVETGVVGFTGSPPTPSALSGYFVPPTLGDTYMFDFVNQTWNLVALYGARFAPSAMGTFPLLDENLVRSATLTTDPSSQWLAPPPLAGGVMVTRTQWNPQHSKYSSATPLLIPEIFLFGGRKKEGTFELLDHVFKFCPSSVGEKAYPNSLSGLPAIAPDDATCDAYNPITTPSPLPFSGYVGRWLTKQPEATVTTDPLTGATVQKGLTSFDPSQNGAYLGAGTYDSIRDLIVLYGGIRPQIPPYFDNAITDLTKSYLNPLDPPIVYEFTPPSAVGGGPNSSAFNGSWAGIPACSESASLPQDRYSHSLAFDPSQDLLLVVGGYDYSGALLTSSVAVPGTPSTGLTNLSNQVPEVWTARRIDTRLSRGIPSAEVPPIVAGPFPCYYWSQITLFSSPTGTSGLVSNLPNAGIAHAAAFFVPPTGYNSGYYTTLDSQCYGDGPLAVNNAQVAGQNVGGIYIDLERTELNKNENLLLNLTIFPFDSSNLQVTGQNYPSGSVSQFKIDLISSGLSLESIQSTFQPRSSTFADTASYPITLPNLSILSPPSGQLVQEQVVIPLSINTSVDRIRIQRVQGSAILIDAKIFRLGTQTD